MADAASEYRTGCDPRTLRDALGCFATGVTVVTCLDPDRAPVGLTVNHPAPRRTRASPPGALPYTRLPSVAVAPPLLLVCIAKQAASAPAFLAARHFAI